MNDNTESRDPRIAAIPDIHGHAKGEHKAFADERPIPYSARMLFLWFFHACKRGFPRFMMVTDHMNYLTFEDPSAVNLVRRALKLAEAGDLYGAAETASVEVGHAAVVSEGLRRGMRFSIGAEVDNDPRCRPDAQNIVDAMRPDGVIRAVHFLTIDHPTAGAGFAWAFDNPEFVALYDHVGIDKTWEIYMETLLKSLDEVPAHIIAHFFVPAKFGHWPDQATLEKYEDQIVAVAKEKVMAIEFNTRFLYKDHAAEERQRYLDANKRLLRKCRDAGVSIAIGSDAHSPRDQGGAFTEVLAILDELEINEIAFALGGRLARVALRVAIPEPPPPPPPEPKRAPARAGGAARTTPSPARPPGRQAPKKAGASKPATEETDAAPTDAVASEAPPAKPAPKAKSPKAAAPKDAVKAEEPESAVAVEAPAEAEAPAPAAKPAKAPRAPKPAAAPKAELAPASTPAPEPEPVPAPAPKPAPALKAKPEPKAAKTAAKSAAKPEPKPAPKPVAKAPEKPPAKAAAAKAPAKPAPPVKKPAPPAPAKKPAAGAKKAAPPAKKAAPVKKAAPPPKKAAPPAKKAAASKAPPKKKAAPAPVKKAVAKKPAAKKPAPAAKKPAAKKAKRR